MSGKKLFAHLCFRSLLTCQRPASTVICNLEHEVHTLPLMNAVCPLCCLCGADTIIHYALKERHSLYSYQTSIYLDCNAAVAMLCRRCTFFRRLNDNSVWSTFSGLQNKSRFPHSLKLHLDSPRFTLVRDTGWSDMRIFWRVDWV